MKVLRTALLTAGATVAALGVLAGSGSAGTSGIASGKIVYWSVDPSDRTVDVFVSNADGSQRINISQGGGARTDSAPEWSPDGSQVAFARTDSNGSSIIVASADGSRLVNISPPSSRGTRDVDPSWSPDGRRIVFSSNRDGNFDLYSVTPAGLGVKTITKSNSPVQNVEPDWSPDGMTIVFSRTGAQLDRGKAGIFRVWANGGSAWRLTSSRSFFGDRHPAWSPSGDSIVFSSDPGQGNVDLYRLDLRIRSSAPARAERLTTGTSYDAEATWAPDGTELVFVSDRTGNPELFAMSLIGLAPGLFPQHQLTCDGLKKGAPHLSPFGQKTGALPVSNGSRPSPGC